MTLFTRWIAVLTVLLGLALMAISAYAAKTEGEYSYPAAGVAAQDQDLEGGAVPGPPSGMSVDEEAMATATAAAEATATVAEAAAAVAAAAAAVPTPAPTSVVRYAAPAGAAPVTRTGGSGANLSPGPRVWPVLSVDPIPANVLDLGEGGLDVPPDQLAVMQQVSLWTGIPWQIYAAIAKVESDFGRNMATSSAGAIGYGQFLPEMWEIFGNGGDPYDFHDAIPAMGLFLLAAGAPADMAGALYAYNHSWPYVAQVLSYAAAYGYQASGTGQSPDANASLIWPVVGPISSYFGPGHPLGIDIDQTALAGAPVRAAHAGIVLFAGGEQCCSYGRYVILVGPSGITTLYAHLDILAVTSRQTVRQGQALGTAGCTGYCTGTHLHFELIDDGVRRNPLDYLP